jgi:hypothetical protein
MYSPANRPNCQEPYFAAISVTVVMSGELSRGARRARFIRRIINGIFRQAPGPPRATAGALPSRLVPAWGS